jgi:hypothetical protein
MHQNEVIFDSPETVEKYKLEATLLGPKYQAALTEQITRQERQR